MDWFDSPITAHMTRSGSGECNQLQGEALFAGCSKRFQSMGRRTLSSSALTSYRRRAGTIPIPGFASIPYGAFLGND